MALLKKDKKKEEVKSDAPVVATSNGLDWVLLKPRITEKSALQMEKNQYTFDVHKNANKSQVKQAVAKAYNVNPVKVNIIIRDTRMTRRRGKKVMDRGYKKAIVTLPKNETIEIV